MNCFPGQQKILISILRKNVLTVPYVFRLPFSLHCKYTVGTISCSSQTVLCLWLTFKKGFYFISNLQHKQRHVHHTSTTKAIVKSETCGREIKSYQQILTSKESTPVLRSTTWSELVLPLQLLPEVSVVPSFLRLKLRLTLRQLILNK